MPPRDAIAKIQPVRPTLRAAPLTILWLCGLAPIALVAIHAASPRTAVEVAMLAEAALRRGATLAAALIVIAALVHPPSRAGIRLLARTLVDRLRADRGPYLRAIGELRHLETAVRHLEAGRAALAVHDAAAALPHLVRAIELDRELLAAHHQLGLALLELGRPDQAVAVFRHVVEREPAHGFGDALLLLARCHMLGRDPATAATLLQRHAREHGGNRRSHFWQGQCLIAQGDRAGARAAFATAAAPPAVRPRLTASEAWYRARARMALLRLGGAR